ncbi:MAG: ATP-binding protein [Pseudomonadales bacterium]|nr:ATP-binding protein [Pseudomonadales bacterium]
MKIRIEVPNFHGILPPMDIRREDYLSLIHGRFQNNPVVGLIGPRQCGKTTLARQFASQGHFASIHAFDCEDPRDSARLENPMLTLEPLDGLVIIDEIQLMPELFAVLRVLADNSNQTRYLILGSAAPELVQKSAESLAGRISYIELGGFSLDEVGPDRFERLWLQGGFPRAFLADIKVSAQWRQDYIRTYLERDLPMLGVNIPAATMRRFWTMLSHYHGQLFNASELGRSLSLNDKTIKRYLDILSGTFLVRQLQPWYYNTRKRLVKSPKIYFRDSGLFHSFLNVDRMDQLLTHPKLGASWEGLIIELTIQHLNLLDDEVGFWAVHSGAELDLVFQRAGSTWGVEVKYQDAPKLTRSMQAACEELDLAHLWVIYPGKKNYPLREDISVVSVHEIQNSLLIP